MSKVKAKEIKIKIKEEKSPKKYLRIVCMSDTHEELGKLIKDYEIPDGDVLIHCGDFTHQGGEKELIQFNEDMGSLTHKHKLVICGNHDSYHRMSFSEIQKSLNSVTYLQETSVVIEGVKFYGSPIMCVPPKMAFYSFEDPEKVWGRIPTDTDVLITHCPPYKILDNPYRNYGDKVLRDYVFKVNPLAHLFGHIHGEYGYHFENETNFINCAISNEPLNPVVYFDFPLNE